jgi:hypothetical protein
VFSKWFDMNSSIPLTRGKFSVLYNPKQKIGTLQVPKGVKGNSVKNGGGPAAVTGDENRIKPLFR